MVGQFGVFLTAPHKARADTQRPRTRAARRGKDLQDFLAEAKSAAPGSVFLAIAGGPFYGGQNGKRGVTRMDNLKRIANN